MTHGAREAIAIVTPGIFSEDACDKLCNNLFTRSIMTPAVQEMMVSCPKVEVLDPTSEIPPALANMLSSDYADAGPGPPLENISAIPPPASLARTVDSDHALFGFAKDVEHVASGLHAFRDSLPHPAMEITNVIVELFSISSKLRG